MPFNLKSIISFILMIMDKLSKKKTVEAVLPERDQTSATMDGLKQQVSIGLEKTVVTAQPSYTPAPPEIAEAIKAAVPVKEESIPAVVMAPKGFINVSQLQAATGCNAATASKFITPINEALVRFNINQPLQIVHFLAQVAHESGSFRYMEELASGAAYEGRKDLGNTSPGDGARFKGRGLIQVTGRSNYEKLGAALGMNLTNGENPKLVAGTDLVCMSAAWFWNYKKDKFGKNLNDFAMSDDVIKITYFVNGGFNGLADRLKHLKQAYIALGFNDVDVRMNRVFNEIMANIDNVSTTNKTKALMAAIPSHKNLAELKHSLGYNA